MAVITLDEMKNYLRVDFEEDDLLLTNLIDAAESICMNVARMEDATKFLEDQNASIAVIDHFHYKKKALKFKCKKVRR